MHRPRPFRRFRPLAPTPAPCSEVREPRRGANRSAAWKAAIIVGLALSTVARAAPEFQNPGFEDPNAAGAGPNAWEYVNQPLWTDDPADVRAGARAVRTTAFQDYYQRVDGLDARTHLTFLAHSRAPDPPGRFSLYASFSPATVVPNWYSARQSIGETYAPVAFPVAIPPSSTFGWFRLRSDWSENWIDSDDVALLVERATNGGFEPDPAAPQADQPSGWRRVGSGGSATWDASGGEARAGLGAARVGPGEGWTQDLAAMEDGQTYVLVLWARADSASSVTTSTVSVSLDWLDTGLATLATQRLSLSLGADWRPQVFFLDPPRGSGLAAARLNLILAPGATSSGVWIDDVAWGWVGAFPDALSPNDDGLWDTTDLVAWWPLDSGFSLSGEIRSTDGATTAPLGFLPTPDGGVGMESASWDGRDAAGHPAPAGTYTAAVRLPLDADGNAVEFTRSLSLRREDTYPEQAASYRQETPFVSGIWLFLGGSWVDVSYDDLFKLVHDDGFQYAIAFPPPDRYRECVRAAARYGLRILLNFWETSDTIGAYWTNRGLTEDDVRSLLEDSIAASDGLSSPVIGFYLVDEPGNPLQAGKAAAFMRVLAGLPNPRPGFTTINPAAGRQQWLQTIRPSVAMSDRYPLVESAADPVAVLQGYGALVESLVSEAEAQGLVCWIVGQGISAAGSNEPPGPGGMRALVWVALAAGARGFFPFLYLSTGNLEGLRGFDWSPRPRLAALQETYRAIDALGPMLDEYRPDPAATPPPVDGPLYCRLWRQPLDPTRRLLWAVNLDLNTTRSLEVDFAAGPVFRIAEPGGAVWVVLPPGAVVARVVSRPVSGTDSIHSGVAATFSGAALPTTILPVLADAPVPATATVVDLAAAPSGRALAVSCAETGFAGGGVYAIDLTHPTTPTLIERLFAWSAERARFGDVGETLASCDSLRGFQVYDFAPPSSMVRPLSAVGERFSFLGKRVATLFLSYPSPALEWAGVSGNAHDALNDGSNGWWVSAGYQGVRHLVPAGAGSTATPAPMEERQRIVTGGYGNRLAWAPPPRDPFPSGDEETLPDPLLLSSQIVASRDDSHSCEFVPFVDQSSLGLRLRCSKSVRVRPWRISNRDTLVILDEYSGIDVVRIASDGTPEPMGFLPGFRGREMAAWAGHLAVARLEFGLDIYDVFDASVPTTPSLRAHVEALSTVQDVALWQDRVLVVVDGRLGLRFFDVLDPSNPREIARVAPWAKEGLSPFLTNVTTGPDWIAVAARGAGVRLLDPQPLNSLLMPRTWMLH